MSGTSLDGLDIAHAAFDFSNPDQIGFQLIHCQTYSLPPDIFDKLSNIFDQTASTIFELDHELARFMRFVSNNSSKISKLTERTLALLPHTDKPSFIGPKKDIRPKLAVD